MEITLVYYKLCRVFHGYRCPALALGLGDEGCQGGGDFTGQGVASGLFGDLFLPLLANAGLGFPEPVVEG
jgi:hypothetical protein